MSHACGDSALLISAKVLQLLSGKDAATILDGSLKHVLNVSSVPDYRLILSLKQFPSSSDPWPTLLRVHK